MDFCFTLVFSLLLGFFGPSKGLPPPEKSSKNGTQVINFKAACSDDETNFRCFSGRCIRQEWLCDGSKDCPDGEDERDPSCLNRDHGRCEAHKVECRAEDGRRKCIPEEWKCDGHADCVHGSDELHCPNTTLQNEASESGERGASHILFPFSAASSCKSFEFRCANAKCIDREFRCDGVDQCGDGSDESKCTVPSRIPAEKEPRSTSQSPKRVTSGSTSAASLEESTSDVTPRSTAESAAEEPLSTTYSTPQSASSISTLPSTSTWSPKFSEKTSKLPHTSTPQPETSSTRKSSISAAKHRLHDEKPQPIRAFVAEPIVPVKVEPQNTTTVVYYDPPIAGNQTEIIEEARSTLNRSLNLVTAVHP